MPHMDLEAKEMFLEESRQLLARLKDKVPFINGETPAEDLNELYLIYHSFKGNARMIGETEMQDLFQALGILVLDMKDFHLEFNDSIRSIFEQTPEKIETLIDRFEAGTPAVAEANEFRATVMAQCMPPNQKNYAQQLEKQSLYFQELGIGGLASLDIDFFDGNSTFYEVGVTLDNTVFLKKTRVYTIIRNLVMMDESVRIGRIVPSLKDLLEERFDLEFALIIQSMKTSEELEEIINYSMEVAAVKIRTLSTTEAMATT